MIDESVSGAFDKSIIELFILERVIHENTQIGYDELDKAIAEQSQMVLEKVRNMSDEDFKEEVKVVQKFALYGAAGVVDE